MLSMPAPTPYDLRFRLLGIPVRVHPLFWIVAALLGGVGQPGVSVEEVLIWIPCVFVSILVHEYGHGLTGRAFGYHAFIALHGWGGLCSSEGERQSLGERLAVTAAGPGAGLALFGLTMVGASALFGFNPAESLAIIGFGSDGAFLSAAQKLRESGAGELAVLATLFLLQINLLWSLFNLLPIWPLDGGRISGVFFEMFNRREGMRRAHALSMVVAGCLSALAFYYRVGFILPFFLAYFAFINFQMLQAMKSYGAGGYGYGDDADFWRR